MEECYMGVRTRVGSLISQKGAMRLVFGRKFAKQLWITFLIRKKAKNL